MNQRNFHKLISGQSVGLTATILRFSMRVAAIGYSLVVRLRNFLYSKQWLKIHIADAPVISIGNITTGGTGKTPLVIWICKFLQQKKIPCAVLTRGYKEIDEPAVLAESCPQTKVIINPDRVSAAGQAVGFGAKALIMDDGFQHRRLHRDLDIVTIDATCPFGYGKLLPAGLLREPVGSLKRTDAVVLTRCDQISESELSRVKEELQIINPDMIIAKSIHKPVCVKSITGEEIALEQLKGKKVFAFCGIGNPDAFLSTIKATGAELVGSKIYDDHYHYSSECLAGIYEKARCLTADLILTTQKDWAKAKMIMPASTDIPFAYLEVEIKFTAEEGKLKQLIEDALAGKIRRKY